jgi:multisubunit Na+/H+ antiporter MnhE subunit
VGEPIKESIDFIRSEFLAAAFVGSIIMLSFWPPSTRTKAVIKVIAAVCISCCTSPAVMYGIYFFYPALPIEANFSIGLALFFWIALLSSHLVKSSVEVLKRAPKAKLPWSER